MTVINIAGVVGVGKSSLCKILEEELNFTVFYEPFVDTNLLENYYKDKKKYSLAMQIYFLSKRFSMYQSSKEFSKSCIDRGIVEDRIFAQMLYKQGMLEDFEFEIYLDVYQNFYKNIRPIDLMVYLQISPENAIKRIKKRGRDYETSQDENYWVDLNNRYETYFKNYSWSKLLVIDVNNLDFVNNKEDKKLLLNKIQTSLT
ncbi:deoxynucleoside kinase [bacterium]|jgi:deoxyadenosine/deoxycytidine kinase|nr:deoxynucleoside kinase [bacterium]MBT6293192.1 deoxynucleoside kinase [bacterium]